MISSFTPAASETHPPSQGGCFRQGALRCSLMGAAGQRCWPASSTGRHRETERYAFSCNAASRRGARSRVASPRLEHEGDREREKQEKSCTQASREGEKLRRAGGVLVPLVLHAIDRLVVIIRGRPEPRADIRHVAARISWREMHGWRHSQLLGARRHLSCRWLPQYTSRRDGLLKGDVGADGAWCQRALHGAAAV